MLHLYGNAKSRAMRCLWMLEEIGEPYQLIEKSTRPDDLQTPEYLRLNPNARIPTLVDGEVVLWESMAINIYLAQKHQGPMRCDSPELLGLAAQWSFGPFWNWRSCCSICCSIVRCCLILLGIHRMRNAASCYCKNH